MRSFSMIACRRFQHLSRFKPSTGMRSFKSLLSPPALANVSDRFTLYFFFFFFSLFLQEPRKREVILSIRGNLVVHKDYLSFLVWRTTKPCRPHGRNLCSLRPRLPYGSSGVCTGNGLIYPSVHQHVDLKVK